MLQCKKHLQGGTPFTNIAVTTTNFLILTIPFGIRKYKENKDEVRGIFIKYLVLMTGSFYVRQSSRESVK